jgi:hypothetical protein
MLTDDELRDNLARLRPFENDEDQIYLDSRGFPTIGVGYCLFSAEDAVRIPFHHVSDGTLATPGEVRLEYFRVLNMTKGLPAYKYRGGPATALHILPADNEAEGFRRLRLMLDGLPHVFPNFEHFPDGVQQRLLDLAWNCGLGAYPGLMGWQSLRNACNATPPNWLQAAHECTTANPNHATTREARNAWRVQGFMDAAKLEAVA